MLVTKAIDKIMTGEGLCSKILSYSKLLRQNMDKSARIIFPHVSAPFNLSNNNKNNNNIMCNLAKYPSKKEILSNISIQTHSITILFAGLLFL